MIFRDIRDWLDDQFRDYPDVTDRDEIREWLREQLRLAGRGARKRLAAHLGFDRPDAITRMLNVEPGKESREIKAEEYAKMLAFFASEPEANPDRTALIEAYDALEDDVKPVALARVLALGPSKSQ